MAGNMVKSMTKFSSDWLIMLAASNGIINDFQKSFEVCALRVREQCYV